MLSVYKSAYTLIHKIDDKANVGFAHSFTPYQSTLVWPLGKLAVFVTEYFSKYFVRKIKGFFDFMGCNYYSRCVISFSKNSLARENVNDLGWEIYPKGIYDILLTLKKYNLMLEDDSWSKTQIRRK